MVLSGNGDPELVGMFHFARDSRTRGHSMKLAIPRHRTDVSKRSLFSRCVRRWNRLPSVVVESTTLEVFKWRLDAELGEELFSFID